MYRRKPNRGSKPAKKAGTAAGIFVLLVLMLCLMTGCAGQGQKEVTFRAPTGSGKTYMMSDLMNRILGKDQDVVFLVSTLSKGGLAEQNYDKFVDYSTNGYFKNLKPYLINTQITSEERLYIPDDYNVYILPRDLYKEGGILMQGGMDNFLQRITSNLFGKPHIPGTINSVTPAFFALSTTLETLSFIRSK